MFRSINFIRDGYIAAVASSTVTYHGYYQPKTAPTGAVDTSVAQFLIAKETKDASGVTTSLQWASRSMDQVWDNRASLTYY